MGYTGDEKRAYQLAWITRRRQSWIDSQGGCCALCGSRDSLEVDHIDPSTKAINPTGIWSRNASVRADELAKCQVLCGVCHKEKTRLAVQLGHGERATYKRGCRCAECRAAQAAALRAFRAK